MGSHYRPAFGEEFAVYCPLVFAGQLWHRVIVNGEMPMTVGRSLGLTKGATVGVLRLLRQCEKMPSQERLAVVAMIIPDVTDEDVAEWFGKSVEWAANVRANADAIRREEYIPAHLEYIDDGYQLGDPSPEEIQSRAMEIRQRDNRWEDVPSERVEIRSYQWTGRSYASIPSGS